MEEIATAQQIAGAVSAAEAALAAAAALIARYSLSALGAIVLLIIGYVAATLAERAVRRATARVRGFDETLQRFFAKLARWVVLVLVMVMVLSQFGVQTASIIAALGAVGLAIGLALQGTLQNVAAGIMLLVLRPLRTGEYISAGDVSGTVVEVGLFATELRTWTGLFVLAPNSQLWNSAVVNFSRNPSRLEELSIGIGYGDDLRKACAILLDLAREDGRVLPEPAPKAFVSQLADSAVIVSLRYSTQPADWFDTARELTARAKLAFDEAGITIPFPQREVKVVGAAFHERELAGLVQSPDARAGR